MEADSNRHASKRGYNLMPQLNINCQKCRKFLKPTASKLIGELKAQAIGECKKCNIKVLSLSTLALDKKKWISNNYETDSKTFEKYKKQFQEKKKSVKQSVLDYLTSNKKAITKDILFKRLRLKKSTIGRIIRVLKKEKLISYNFLEPYRYKSIKRKKYVMLKMPELITKNSYPKKVFGELTLKGGLNNINQTIRIKYLLPTKDYPTGKAVIEIIVPDNINTFILSNDDLKPIMEINNELAKMIEIANDEMKQIIACQMEFNQKIINIASDTKKKPHIIKSFRFNEKDYIETHILMSHLAQLFGYLFYKNKTEIEKEANVQHLMASRDAVANFMSENVFKKFKAGFMEGYEENH